MSTFNMIIRKSIVWIGAMITLTVLLVLMSEASYAAKYPIEIKFDETKGETTYDLYYMGTFGENGKFVFDSQALNDALGDPPNYKIDDMGKDAWEKAWMDAAFAAKNYVTGSDSDRDPVATKTTSADEFTFDGTFEEGFYLIVGSEVKIKDPATGKITYYWPMPMYVRVLNGKAEYSLKPDQGTAATLSVLKVWEGDEEVKDIVRPKSITIHREYDGKKKEDIELPILDDQGNEVWEYSWETDKGEDNPNKWVITEEITDQLRLNYYVDIAPEFILAPGSEQLTITNTYDRQALEIIKIMKDYINNRDESLQDFVFDIKGYEVDNEEPVYHHVTGLSFGINSPGEDTAFITGIPANVTRITVKETYSGNYMPEGDTEVEAEFYEDDNVWKAEFTNVIRPHDNPPTYNTGVINKYSITGDGQFSFRGTDRDPKQEVQ